MCGDGVTKGGHEHPWKLVAPWYRWQRPGDVQTGRASRPVFQKYASTSFMEEFLAEPQRSLKFLAEDAVHKVVAGKANKYSLADVHLEPTDLRKIFLPTHGRFYLVVCELHCDTAGFPRVGRDAVCQAGFVVRRRAVAAPPAARKEAAGALLDFAAAEAKINAVASLEKKSSAAMSLAAAEEQAFVRLRDIVAKHQVKVELQGWVPSGLPGIGAWMEVEETPGVETPELVYPLYPLIPDPAQRGHSAAGRTIWFGLLPAGGAETDAAGIPRFDERSLYEVRCFVRRHDPCCPKQPGKRDCRGPLTWSLPTERYQLAPHFDLDGTNLRPVTVQLPDLEALRAQASALPFGAAAGVRMVSPPKSAMELTADGTEVTGAGVEGAAICSFAIPLITIVASFVLRLFLPIVVIAFGLWFLLRLKFCIPPAVSIDAGLVAALDADIKAGIDIDVEFEAKIHAQLDANFPAEMSAGLKADLDLNALAALTVDLASDFSGSVPPDLAPDLSPHAPPAAEAVETLPAAEARLQYHERVEVAA